MNAPIPSHLLPKLSPRPVPAAMLDALKARFADRCSTALAVREQHGRDESPFDVPPPEVVVFCESNEDVADVVKLADRHAVPVIPYGAGSSLEGHLLAVQGGVSIDLTRMNRVLQVQAEDLTVTVQARYFWLDAAEAHREVEKGHTRGKVALIVDEDLAASLEV